MKNLEKILQKYGDDEKKHLIIKYPSFYIDIKNFCIQNDIPIYEMDLSIDREFKKSYYLFLKNLDEFLYDIKNKGNIFLEYQRHLYITFCIVFRYKKIITKEGWFSTKKYEDDKVEYFNYYPLNSLHNWGKTTKYDEYIRFYSEEYTVLNTSKFLDIIQNNNSIVLYKIPDSYSFESDEFKIQITETEKNKLIKLYNFICDYLESIIKEFKKQNENHKEIIKTKIDEMKNQHNIIFQEEDLVYKLVSKHQQNINPNHLHNIIRLTNYLKQKKDNIINLILLIKRTNYTTEIELIEDKVNEDVYEYNLILTNSFMMINSCIDGDMLNYFTIYEKFDKLNIFNSNSEKEISNKLSDVNKNLQDLIMEIKNSSNRIIESINDLSFITEKSTHQINSKLVEIDSTLQVGNLLNLIQTYQMYKVNKNTKNLT